MTCNPSSYFALPLALAFFSAARADVTFSEDQDGGVTVIRMSVTPAAEADPALKHRLVARDIEQKPGNAAPYYYRAHSEFRPILKAMREKYNDETELGGWYGTGEKATPIAKLPLDKVRAASQMFDSVYDSNLKPAFQRSGCDWQLNVEELRGPEIISIHLSEFQDSREIGRMLALRTRLAIAEHRYGDAVELMRQNYRLGRDVAEVPFLVCGLIGIAIENITNRTLVEFIANPDSPNLYWAIGELPQPPIDIRPAVRFEIDFGPRVFPFIHNTETTDHSPQEWNRLLTQTIRDLQVVGEKMPMFNPADSFTKEVSARLTATAIGLTGYSHAKERLIAQGMNRALVEEMSVGQVIAIYTERNYRHFADDWEKLWQVPFEQSGKMADQLERKRTAAKPFGAGEDREILPLLTLLLPALQACREAQVRLDREVASLRVIEALRLYAASHGGSLPTELKEIEQVPVPNNPATGKPFAYQLNGTTAVLELPPTDRVRSGNCRYEIQIAAKK
jgi:hypothetical protein